jgi:hypothetical protein
MFSGLTSFESKSDDTMSELELSKLHILHQLRSLCAHCGSGLTHTCPLQDIIARIEEIRGVPLLVNNEFRGVLWADQVISP